MTTYPYPTAYERHSLGRVAVGEVPPRLILRGGRVLNVYTGQLVPQDVWIWEKWIARLTSDPCRFDVPSLDMSNNILIPGLIDGHIHIESSLLDPIGFSKLALTCGVTTVVTDFHEVSAVAGLEGIRAMLSTASQTPMKFFLVLPMPFDPHHHAGQPLTSIPHAEFHSLLLEPQVLGLSEVIGSHLLEELVGHDIKDLALLSVAAASKRLAEGHLFRIRGADLDACLAVGVSSDHEVRDPDELEEKIAKGLFMMLRSGTIAREVETLIRTVVERDLPRCRVGLVTDDILASDIRPTKYGLNKVRLAVEHGVDPIDAIRMVTYNVASHYGISSLSGVLTPGACADIVVLDALDSLEPLAVLCAGEFFDKNTVHEPARASYPGSVLTTIPRRPLQVSHLEALLNLPAGTSSATVRAIRLDEATRFTTLVETMVPVSDGRLHVENCPELCYLVCASRMRDEGVTVGFLHGYGLRAGAVAVSIAHDRHDLISIGRSLDDVVLALNRIIQNQGGLVFALHGVIDCELPLPIAGLMTQAAPSETVARLEQLHIRLREMGASWREPLFYIFWLGMEMAPRYRITPDGIIDTVAKSAVPVLVC